MVLGDSVLGFHKHGMQGLSLATTEVCQVSQHSVNELVVELMFYECTLAIGSLLLEFCPL